MTSDTLAMINAYLDEGHGSTMEQIILKQAYGDIVRLTAERDEARRDVCDMMHMTGFLAGDFAHSKGWDCFKDGDKHPWSDDVVNFRNIYYAYSDELTAQRDEARRYSCDLEARITMLEEDRRDTSNNFGTNPCSEIILPDYPLARDPKEIAKRKGWDCFKEDGNA
jgi:hypothetical protein